MIQKVREFFRYAIKSPFLVCMFFTMIFIFLVFFIMDYSINSLFGEEDTINETTIMTEYGDDFVLVEKSFYIKQAEYYVEVYRGKKTKKNFVAKAFKEYEKQPIDIKSIYKSDDITCYSFLNEILYKQKDMKTFGCINIIAFRTIKVDEYLMFVPVAQKFMSENDWKWIVVFSEFMVRLNDDYTIKLLQRYARNDITDDEINKNQNSGYTKEAMQKFSSDILSKYNLNKL